MHCSIDMSPLRSERAILRLWAIFPVRGPVAALAGSPPISLASYTLTSGLVRICPYWSWYSRALDGRRRTPGVPWSAQPAGHGDCPVFRSHFWLTAYRNGNGVPRIGTPFVLLSSASGI